MQKKIKENGKFKKKICMKRKNRRKIYRIANYQKERKKIKNAIKYKIKNSVEKIYIKLLFSHNYIKNAVYKSVKRYI